MVCNSESSSTTLLSDDGPISLLCLSVSGTTQGRHFAAGRVASFAEGRIGHQEWARRNGQLSDIHSLDDRFDHDVDELMA
jgi:hypothetical protein